MLPALLQVAELAFVHEVILTDRRPSSAIASASYDPITGTAHIRFTGSDKIYEYPCDPEKWIEYLNEDSPGVAFHQVFAGK